MITASRQECKYLIDIFQKQLITYNEHYWTALRNENFKKVEEIEVNIEYLKLKIKFYSEAIA